MAKLSKQSSCDTSFYEDTIITTLQKLTESLGIPQDGGGDKVQYEWTCETIDGDVFSIYDWKEGHFGETTLIEFHIGAHNPSISWKAKTELREMGI